MNALTSQSHSRDFAELRAELAGELAGVFRELVPELASDLQAAGERSSSGHERQQLLAASGALTADPARRAARVAAAFDERVLRILEACRNREAEARALALLDHEVPELDRLSKRLAWAVRDFDAALYADYAARVRAISPVDWSDERFDPLGASALSQALVAGLVDVIDAAPVLERLHAVLPDRVAPRVGPMLAQARERLAHRGIEPAAVPAMPGARGSRESGRTAAAGTERPSGARRAAGNSGQPDAVERVASADSDARLLGTSALAGLQSDTRLRVLPTLQPVIDIERDAVAFAHSIGEIPYSRSARSRYFANVRQRLEEAGASVAQLAVVDIVAAMFDYVVDDRRLPQAAQPLVWRLQQPALALALLDPGYLGDEPRSLRRLIENFGAIANAFAEDLTRGSELYRRMETVVRAVEIVTSALQARSAVMSQQVEREYLRAAGHVGQLIERIVRERNALEATPGRRNRRDYTRRPNRDQEREVTERIERMLDDRLSRHSVPESVREFLMKVWLRHLRTAAFRDGEDSSEFRIALQVVDDLLWTLDAGGEKHVSRRELVQRIPPLIQVLTQGLREIGAKEEEHRGFFDELFLIHLRRLQRRERTTRVAPASDGGTRATASHGAQGAPATVPTRPSRATMYDIQGSVPTLREALTAPPAPAPAPSPPVTADAAGAVATVRGGDDVPAADADGEAERSQRLLEVLNSVDLADLPAKPRRRVMDPAAAFAAVARGDWLEMEGRDGSQRYMKIAWINRRRTVALLVRHPDRRALSLQMAELARRFVGGRAFLVGHD